MAVPEQKVSARIVDAARASELDPSLIGGKAFNLAKLSRAGLPIPPWFCLTTLVFRDLFNPVAAAELGRPAAPPSPDGDSAGASVLRSAARRIAEKTKSIRLLPADTDALYRHFDSTFPPGAVVAVRSSAIGEDSAKDSFAGQLETFLYVTRESVQERAIACFASAFSERALLYRSLRAGGAARIEAAVIIQLMVESTAAGVTFTANPTTGNENEMVVSAAYGLGEGVVAGLVESDTWLLDSESGRIRDQIIADKHLQVVFDGEAGSGTRIVPVLPEPSRRPVLSDAQLAALHGLCRRVRDFYGTPQDVEWAVDASGTIHLLQARPITTLKHERENIFDNSNVVESYPGLSLPLTFSYARNGYAATFR
jgi:pyruvate,water dikinase